MTALRVTGLAMVAIQALLLHCTMGYKGVSIPIVLMALAGCWPRIQLAWPVRWRYVADAAVVALFVFWWWIDLQHIKPRSQQYDPNVTLAAAMGFMGLQALRFYWRAPHGLRSAFPILGILSLASAGDFFIGDPTLKRIFFWGAMTHGLLSAVFYVLQRPEPTEIAAAFRRYRYAMLGICLLLSLLLASGTAWTLSRADRFLQPWMARPIAAVQQVVLGNSEMVRLGSMREYDGRQAERIALQIYADSSPGYLRGQAYAHYGQGRWEAMEPGETVVPDDGAPPPGYKPELPGEYLFPVAPNKTQTGSMSVYPDREIRNAVFAPWGTGWVGMSAGVMLVNDASVVTTRNDLDARPYRVLATPPTTARPLSAREYELYTQLPQDVGGRLKELSDRVCAGRDTTGKKALAVAQYFTANYTYSLDFESTYGEDPLERFLFTTPPPAAHCEYFASGATLMLRAAGVPARYITGVVGWEQHPYGSHWVVRNRDAHAWCEAWDPEMGWFIVEATPAGGLPEAAPVSSEAPLRDFWSMLVLNLRRGVDAVRTGAWHAVQSAAVAIAAGAAGLLRESWPLVLLITALALLAWWFRRYWPRRSRHTANVPAWDRRLGAQLSQMDRHVARAHHLKRASHRTIHGFAQEIETSLPGDAAGEQLAAWYRKWAHTRYRPTEDEVAFQALERDAAALSGREKQD